MDRSAHPDAHIMTPSPPHPQLTFSSNLLTTTTSSHATPPLPSFNPSRPSSSHSSIFSTSSSASTAASLPPSYPPDHEISAGYASLLPGITYTTTVCQLLNWYNFLASLGRAAITRAAQSEHHAGTPPSTADPLPWPVRSALTTRHQEHSYRFITAVNTFFRGVDILQVPYEDFRCPHSAVWDRRVGALLLSRLFEPGQRRREWLMQERKREMEGRGKAVEGLGPAGPGRNRDLTGVFAGVARRAVRRLQWREESEQGRKESVRWEVEFRRCPHGLDEMVIELGRGLGYVVIHGAPREALQLVKDMMNTVMEEDGFTTRCVEVQLTNKHSTKAARELAISTKSTAAARLSDVDYAPLSSDKDPLLAHLARQKGERMGVRRRLVEWMRDVKRASRFPACAKLRKRRGRRAGGSGRILGGNEECEECRKREASARESKTRVKEVKKVKEVDGMMGEKRDHTAILRRWWRRRRQGERVGTETQKKRRWSESDVKEWSEVLEEAQRKAGARSQAIRQVGGGDGGKRMRR